MLIQVREMATALQELMGQAPAPRQPLCRGRVPGPENGLLQRPKSSCPPGLSAQLIGQPNGVSCGQRGPPSAAPL